MLIHTNSLLDDILNYYRLDIGTAFNGYRNHCYRVLNFYSYLCMKEKCFFDEKVVSVALAFHDLGMWSHKTLDYLAPSVLMVTEYFNLNIVELTTQEKIDIIQMIELHHKLSVIVHNKDVELFRQADTADFSLGLMRFGIPFSFIHKVRSTFPNHDFHKGLFRLSLKHILKNPFNPFPMYKI